MSAWLNKDGSVKRRYLHRCRFRITAPDGSALLDIDGRTLSLFREIANTAFNVERAYRATQPMLFDTAAAELPATAPAPELPATAPAPGALERFVRFVEAAKEATTALPPPDFVEWFCEQADNVIDGTDAECWDCGTAVHLGPCVDDGGADAES